MSKFDGPVEEAVYTLVTDGLGEYFTPDCACDMDSECECTTYYLVSVTEPTLVTLSNGKTVGVPNAHFIVHEDAQGFVYVHEFGSRREALSFLGYRYIAIRRVTCEIVSDTGYTDEIVIDTERDWIRIEPTDKPSDIAHAVVSHNLFGGAASSTGMSDSVVYCDHTYRFDGDRELTEQTALDVSELSRVERAHLLSRIG